MNLRVDHFTFDAAPGPQRGWHPSRSMHRYFCGQKYVPNEELVKFPTFPEPARRQSRGWDAGLWHVAGGFRRSH